MSDSKECQEGFARAYACDRECHSCTEAIEYYDKTWAKYYDKDTEAWQRAGFNIYSAAMECLKQHINGPDAKILDVARGTGFFGEKMVKNGFKNVSLLDGSKEMIKIARSKVVYKEIFEQILQPDISTVVPDKSFDFVVALSCFFKNHLSPFHIPLLLKMLKVGGKLIIGQGAPDDEEGWKSLRAWINNIDLAPNPNFKLIQTRPFQYRFDPETETWENGMVYVIQQQTEECL